MTKKTEDPSSIPANWVWARLGEIGTVTSGGTPSTSVPEFFDGSIPWITPSDLSSFAGKFIQRGKRNISEKGLNSSSAVLLPAGAVLFSSRAPIGYVAIAANPVATNQGFKNLVLHGGVFNEYVFHYLKGNKELAESYGSGTTFREVSASRFAQIPIPLAPFDEQKRIVGKVEELFGWLDAGVEGLKRVGAQLKRYRQAVLKYAFEGKLTEKWRKTYKDRIESATRLLEKVKEKRKENREGRYRKLPPIDAEGLPSLPGGWTWTRLGEIISAYSGKGLGRGRINRQGKYPVYGGNGIAGYHDEFMFEESKLIIGRVGAKCGVVHITLPRCWVTDNALVVDSWLLNRRYLYYALHALDLNRYSGSTAQAVVCQSKIYPLVIRLPPLAEQERIVEEIDTRSSMADEVERVVLQSLKQSNRLRESVLKRAFEGQLVPQDPSDEPAEKLIERIREEKSTGKSFGKRMREKGMQNSWG